VIYYRLIFDSLAYAEARVILARLIWNFDFELDERSKNWSQQKMLIFWEKPPLFVRLIPVTRGV